MKSKIIVSFAVVIMASLGWNVQSATTNSENSTNEYLAYNRWHETEIISAAQAKQVEFKSKLDEIQANIEPLRKEISKQADSAKSLRESIEKMREEYLDKKKIIPKDPWREIYGEKIYLMSSDSHFSFIRFGGQVLETAPNGIRVLGWVEDNYSDKTEYFVLNFPYSLKDGESIYPNEINKALADGEFSYVTEDGFAKKLKKLNYGSPCARPKNAKDIEEVALQLTPEEKKHLKEKEMESKEDDDAAMLARKRMQEVLAAIEKVQMASNESMREATNLSVKYTLAYADKGVPDALLRMGERYQIGDGVEIDVNKSITYFNKAKESSKIEAQQIEIQRQLDVLTGLKEKFLSNLKLADKDDVCAFYVSKCYREGIGTERNPEKAQEYQSKALDLRDRHKKYE